MQRLLICAALLLVSANAASLRKAQPKENHEMQPPSGPILWDDEVEQEVKGPLPEPHQKEPNRETEKNCPTCGEPVVMPTAKQAKKEPHGVPEIAKQFVKEDPMSHLHTKLFKPEKKAKKAAPKVEKKEEDEAPVVEGLHKSRAQKK